MTKEMVNLVKPVEVGPGLRNLKTVAESATFMLPDQDNLRSVFEQ